VAKTHAAGKTPRPPQPAPTGGGQRVGLRRFMNESWAELRKVQWPSRQAVVQGTLVVFVVTLFFALFLTAVDYLAVRFVTEIDKFLK
jgi:preprotein translocase subunit SecE